MHDGLIPASEDMSDCIIWSRGKTTSIQKSVEVLESSAGQWAGDWGWFEAAEAAFHLNDRGSTAAVGRSICFDIARNVDYYSYKFPH